MTAPVITWVIAGQPIIVTDWSCNSVANGGFDQMRGQITETAWNRLTPPPTQGSVVRGDLPNGKVLWEGRLSAPPSFNEGMAEIAAQGEKIKAERLTTRRLYKTQDYALWSDAADEPFTFPVAANSLVDDIEAEVRNTSLCFQVGGGVAYTAADQHVLAIWAPNALITRYAFDITHQRSNGNFDIRVQRFTGPDNARTLVADHGMAAADPDTGSNTIGVPQDALSIAMRCNTGNTPAASGEMIVRLTALRLYGLTTADTYYPSDVVSGVGTDCAYDISGVTAGAVLNILPLDWEGPWDELLDYIAMLDDATWRVVENRGAGPRLEYHKWSAAPAWTTRRSFDARLELTALELLNKVVVSYTASHGRQRESTVTASPDPLAGTGITNTHYEELEDVQPSSALATNVANNLLARLSVQRYDGSIEVTKALDAGGRDAAWEIRGGDTITVEDWGPGARKLMRIIEVEYSENSVSLGIEGDVTADRMLARAALREQQRPRKRRGRR